MTVVQRSRVTGVYPPSTPPSVQYNKQLLVNGSATTTYYGGLYDPYEYRAMNDYVDPLFKRRKANGEMVFNNMTSEYILWTPVRRPSKWTWAPTGGWAGTDVCGFDVADVAGFRFTNAHWGMPYSKLPIYWQSSPPSSPDSNEQLVLTDAAAKIASPDAMVLVTLGELRETLEFLGSIIAVLLRKAEPFKVLRKRYLRGELSYRDFLQEFASLWLKYRYAIMPLIYEAQGYMKAFSKSVKPQRETARAMDKDSVNVSWTHTATSSMIGSIALNCTMTGDDEIRAGFVYENEDTLAQRLGLRLVDVPTSIWELVKLSFVADWFANTGDYLAAITFQARAHVLGAWSTRSIAVNVIMNYAESGSVYGSYYNGVQRKTTAQTNGTGTVGTYVYKATRRLIVNPASWQPTWSPRLAFSTKRVIDALSLLATMFDVSERRKPRTPRRKL